jgi:hypothetical protein
MVNGNAARFGVFASPCIKVLAAEAVIEKRAGVKYEDFLSNALKFPKSVSLKSHEVAVLLKNVSKEIFFCRNF